MSDKHGKIDITSFELWKKAEEFHLFQVLNKSGNPASDELDDMCLFPTQEKAETYIDYLREDVYLTEERFDIKIWHIKEMFTIMLDKKGK